MEEEDDEPSDNQEITGEEGFEPFLPDMQMFHIPDGCANERS